MEKLKNKITVSNIITVFIILQPIIDVITGLSLEKFNVSITFGIATRTIFMLFVVILGLIKSTKKYRIGMITYFSVVFIYMAIFLVNSYLKNGMELIFFQIKGLIKIFYLPIILVSLIPIFKFYKINIDNKILSISLMIYSLIIFVCNILGISFLTYKAADKAGTVGLFYSANEIGAIFSILSPFFLVGLIKKKLEITDYICLFLLIYSVLQIGTKVPYFGFIILMLIIVFACIINGKRLKKSELYKKAGAFLALVICVYLITGLTPVGKNLTNIYGDIFIITEDTFNNTEEEHEITEFKDFEEFTSTTVSQRSDFLKKNKEMYVNANFVGKLFGIGFVENNNEELTELKLTEMDYYDILFCSGIIGTILFAFPFIVLGIVLIYYTSKDKTKLKIEHIYSIGIVIVVSLLAGHVLTSPAVSIYVAIILANYFNELMKRKRGDY